MRTNAIKANLKAVLSYLVGEYRGSIINQFDVKEAQQQYSQGVEFFHDCEPDEKCGKAPDV